MNNLNPTFSVVPLVIMALLSPARRDDAPETALVKVPTLKGQQTEIARQTLRLMELQAQSGTYYLASRNWRPEFGRSIVRMQTPQPGSLLPEGATVAYWTFAEAPKDAKVVKTPDVRKRASKQAVQMIVECGLVPIGLQDQTEGKADDVIVVDQYPRPGQSVFEGTSVYCKTAPP